VERRKGSRREELEGIFVEKKGWDVKDEKTVTRFLRESHLQRESSALVANVSRHYVTLDRENARRLRGTHDWSNDSRLRYTCRNSRSLISATCYNTDTCCCALSNDLKVVLRPTQFTQHREEISVWSPPILLQQHL